MSLRRAWLSALLLAPALFAATARADVEVETRLGHGGRWVSGCATPVSVTLKNDGTEPVSVRLALSEREALSSGPVRHERSVFLGPGATRREAFVLPSPAGFGAALTLDVETEPRVPVHSGSKTSTRGRMTVDVQGPLNVARTVLSPAGRIVGVLGDERSVLPSLLPQAVREKLAQTAGELVAVEVLPIHPDDLDLAPIVLDGLDSLVVIDPEAGLLSDRAALDGVLDWVALGGTLIVSPGSRAASLGATPLGPHLPPVQGPVSERSVADVLRAAAVWAKEKVKDQPEGRPTPFLQLAAAEGVPVTADAAPLWAERILGAGRIRLLAFDARVALRAARDPGHQVAVAAVLSGRAAPVRDTELAEFVNEFRFGGSVDVEDAMTNVLRKNAFKPPSFFVIVAMLALYVAIVGPLDWLVLRRMGRQRLTTFTFGGAVIIFTVVAYGASFLVFSAGSVLNRVVFVDLQDAGRGGRQVIRVQDVVGYYSPRGSDRALSYGLPAALVGSALPGGGSAGEVGTAYPVLVSGRDPLEPVCRVQVAFRSQRVVRTHIAGVTGRTIETEWLPAESADGEPRLRVANGLPTDIDKLEVLVGGRARYTTGPLASGSEVILEPISSRSGMGAAWQRGGSLREDPSRSDVTEFLAFLSRLSPDGFDGGPVDPGVPEALSLGRQAHLARTGIARGAGLGRGHALLLAAAHECPIPLPGADEEGETHVMIRKEIQLP